MDPYRSTHRGLGIPVLCNQKKKPVYCTLQTLACNRVNGVTCFAEGVVMYSTRGPGLVSWSVFCLSYRSVVLAEEDRGSVCVQTACRVWTPFISRERRRNTHIKIKGDDHKEEWVIVHPSTIPWCHRINPSIQPVLFFKHYDTVFFLYPYCDSRQVQLRWRRRKNRTFHMPEKYWESTAETISRDEFLDDASDCVIDKDNTNTPRLLPLCYNRRRPLRCDPEKDVRKAAASTNDSQASVQMTGWGNINQ